MMTSVDSSPTFLRIFSRPLSTDRWCSCPPSGRSCGLDECVQALPGELLQLIGDIDRVEEAALRAGVAGGAGFDDVDDERVLVAVGGDGDDLLHVAGGLALAPDLPAAAGPEYGAALGNRQGQRLGIHVGEGQHLFGIMVLHDGRDQAFASNLRVLEFSVISMVDTPKVI